MWLYYWFPLGKKRAPFLKAFHSCSQKADAISTLTLRKGIFGSSHLMHGITSLCGRDTQLHTLVRVYFLQMKIFMLPHCCCPLCIQEGTRQLPAGTNLIYIQWWTSVGTWEDSGLSRFSHKISLVFTIICLWWALLRGTSRAKRREIKIIAKPQTIKINPRLRREMHIFHPCLDMTHQYSSLHAAWGAAPELPSLSLTYKPRWPQIYSYITCLAHRQAYRA